jgi:hypothetical protein
VALSVSRRGRALVVLAASALIAACFIVRHVAIDETVFAPRDTVPPDSVSVSSPVKAHLLDGHTVVYPNGLTIARDTLRGSGTRYDLRLHQIGTVSLVPLDSVLGMENYRTAVDLGASLGYSFLATAGVIAATVAIACTIDPKCFGSCPTFYSDSAGTAVLEAEGFSYSIAPLFEARDVDRLRAQPDANGRLRLEVRNEAYETHFLNHLELLEARHGPDELVVPDAQGRLLAVDLTQTSAPTIARDAAGRDVRPQLAAADGNAFSTDSTTLARAGRPPAGNDDAIDLALPVPPGTDSVALVFHLRNSLLNTVLLYDMMLGDAGARSLDWMAGDLERIGPALELGRWYAANMGLRIEVRDSGGAPWREAGRIRDTGPVAWKDVAALIAVPPPSSTGDTLHLRLSFVADNWRIDRVAVARAWRRPETIRHPLARAVDAGGVADTGALASLSAPDQRYLETLPGQRFTAEWMTGRPAADSGRTFFLASQGYYIEWIRRGWLAAPRARVTFAPSDSALPRALARYREVKTDLERRFAATRVPVR